LKSLEKGCCVVFTGKALLHHESPLAGEEDAQAEAKAVEAVTK
jgi:hypothetical protein